MPRKSEGRQKIEIVKITKQSNSSVAFTKRRSGIFKKASELCTLCGAQIAIIVLSQTRKKLYSFGDPGVEEIVKRFMEQGPDPPTSRTSEFMELIRNANFQELNTQLTNMLGQLEAVKKTGAELKKIRKERQQTCWWDEPVEDLGMTQLEQLKVAMLEMNELAQKQAERYGSLHQ